jgi:hypothetical protein
LTTSSGPSSTNSLSISTNTIPAVSKASALNSDNLPAAAAASLPVETAAAAPKPGVSKAYQLDPILDETERIMLDYISMLSANKVLTVTK